MTYDHIRPMSEAPIRLQVEVWPALLKAKATLTENGKDRDVTISASIVAFLLNWLKTAAR